MRSAVAALALGLTLAAAGLSSCASPEVPMPPPTPDPSVTPVYASEEEALAAAEELYGRYVHVSDALGESGWRDTSKLTSVADGALLESDLENAADFAARGWTQKGSATFDSVRIQQLQDHGPGALFLTIYVCLDVSNVDVVDGSGLSVVSPSRPKRQALEVDMNDRDGQLKLTRSDAWSGANFC